ncbi:MAG: hypothetical protein LBR16_01710 [Treponema sp.]|nr:hypothetical protein [Treponema sp.]
MNTELLLKIGRERFKNDALLEPFTKDEAADAFVSDLEHFPHRFVLACLMDRQIKYEKAWEIPYRVSSLTGKETIAELSSISKDEYVRLFVENSLHRFNEKMADIFYCGVQDIKNKYDGNAAKIWANTPSSAALVGRFLEFKGAGPKIATMAANLLVRHFKVPLSDYYSIDISVDTHVRRVMTRLGCVPKGAKIETVIHKAREISPEFPGLIDFACFEIGRECCHPTKPDCEHCAMRSGCDKVI